MLSSSKWRAPAACARVLSSLSSSACSSRAALIANWSWCHWAICSQLIPVRKPYQGLTALFAPIYFILQALDIFIHQNPPFLFRGEGVLGVFPCVVCILIENMRFPVANRVPIRMHPSFKLSATRRHFSPALRTRGCWLYSRCIVCVEPYQQSNPSVRKFEGCSNQVSSLVSTPSSRGFGEVLFYVLPSCLLL